MAPHARASAPCSQRARFALAVFSLALNHRSASAQRELGSAIPHYPHGSTWPLSQCGVHSLLYVRKLRASAQPQYHRQPHWRATKATNPVPNLSPIDPV